MIGIYRSIKTHAPLDASSISIPGQDTKPAARGCGKDVGVLSPGFTSEALKALGHPVRLEIVRQLAGRDRCCAGDFCACLPLAQSTISQHLEMLLAAGLVERRPEGTRSIFTLNRERLAALAAEISALPGCCAKPEKD